LGLDHTPLGLFHDQVDHGFCPPGPGLHVTSEVVEIGAGVTRFDSADAVVAFVDRKRRGGYAERAVVKESAAALNSASLSFAEAAALPIAGCTALQPLRDVGGLREGGSVLIHGGAGGVGHFAVQIARALGATVAATCGPSNIAFVQSIGADTVIDYTREDFTRRAERFDVVFDAVAKSSFPACRHLLNPGDTYVTTLPGPGILFWGAMQSAAGLFGRAKRARFLMVRPDGSDLAFLGQLADQGQLRPILSRTFPLERAPEAQAASEEGHARGKIVLGVGS
jgi:NADPH:quinone reductase-like Zn-dependent oxidoreductase